VSVTLWAGCKRRRWNGGGSKQRLVWSRQIIRMKAMLKPLLFTAVAVIVGLFVYDKWVRPALNKAA